MHSGHPHFSGLRMGVMARMDASSAVLNPVAQIPPMTHNCQLIDEGVLMNSTGQDAAVIADPQGRVLKAYEYPRYDESELTHTAIPGDFARQAFGRGLCTDPSGTLLIAGSSPGTVSVFDKHSGERIQSVQVTNDLRNAPHGLEVWPFGS